MEFCNFSRRQQASAHFIIILVVFISCFFNLFCTVSAIGHLDTKMKNAVIIPSAATVIYDTIIPFLQSRMRQPVLFLLRNDTK